MWAIMKQFRVLPTDPRLKALTYAQREFIIASMLQDNEEQREQMEAQAKGGEVIPKVTDDTFDDTPNDIDIDPDEIYSQVVAKTEDKEYDKNLTTKLENAIKTKDITLEDVQRTKDRAFQQLSEEAKKALGIN